MNPMDSLFSPQQRAMGEFRKFPVPRDIGMSCRKYIYLIYIDRYVDRKTEI